MAVNRSEDVKARGLVLLVEDEAPTSRLLSTTLSFLGFHVKQVRSAEAALDAIAEQSPDIIVADIRLPGADGIALVENVRSLPGGDDIPVLLMSAYGRPRNHRATRFLAKPFELARFERVVEEMAG